MNGAANADVRQTPPVMVFHAPYPLEDKPKAASGLRPLKMRAAFEALGFDVIEITGYARERRNAVKRLVKQLENGLRVDFVYSESATIPNSFTEPRHVPLHPFLDRSFFKEMKKRGIPIGLFYRDVYWAFPEYVERVGPVVAAPMKALYKWDLDAYTRYLNVLFVPSVGLVDAVRRSGRYERLLHPAKVSYTVCALPPAGEFSDCAINTLKPGQPLRLLYVGGIDQKLYNLTMLLQVVMARADVSLTLCVPENSWAAFTSKTGFVAGDNIKVVHTRGSGLDPYYDQAHVCCLYMPPDEYRSFAAPVKFFEYLAHSRPILATADTYAAQLVEEEGVGWAIPYGEQELNAFLDDLLADPTSLEQKADAARSFGQINQWTDRAQEVADVLESGTGCR